VGAVGGAAEIHLGIDDPLSTFFAEAGGVVFKELEIGAAVGALGLEDRTGLPVAAVLSGAFHVSLPLCRVS
jgi:hypothetical protein